MRSALAIVVAVLVALLVELTGFGDRIELASIDARYEQRGSTNAVDADEVVVLEIDDATDAAVVRGWPYPRSMHAPAIRRLVDAGARVIVLDVQFLDPTEPAEDDALVRAIAQARTRGVAVVLATAADEARGGVPRPFEGIDAARDVPAGTLLRRSGAYVGRTDTDTDGDGTVRRAPSLRLHEPVPSLAVAALRAAGEADPDDGLDDRLLSFATERDDIESTNYAAALLDDGEGLDIVSGRIVFVGATSAVLHDVVRTPLDAALPGVYLHAMSWLDLRESRGLDVAPGWVGPIVAGAFALVLALLATGPLRRRIAWWTVLGLTLPIAWVVLATWAFTARELIVPVASPVLGSLAALMLLLVAVARVAIRERRHVATVFSRYLAPRVVRQLIASDVLSVGPGGVSAEVTVLFSDVRGFTSLSARTPPGELVAQLNEYLEEMVAAIDAQEGTVDKFLGDGMMAFFGAPAAQDDHAARAVAAARDMLERLERVNAARASRGLDALEIGIGIASGDVVVGNIGSTRRLEYTAIGDAVNLASRLESATKSLDAPVLMDSATFEAVDASLVIERGAIEVRGVARPVRVATLAVGDASTLG